MALYLGYKKPKDGDSNNYHEKSDGTMTGHIDLDGNDITGIADNPLTDTSVVSKKYVKDNYVNNSGGTGMTGNLDMNRNIIFNLANDSSLGSAVNREFVHATFLQKAGGTMSGNINMNGNDINGLPNVPPTNSSAASKTYLFTNYLSKTSLTDLDMNNNHILGIRNINLPNSAVTRKYINNTFLPKLGGRLQGILYMNNRNINNLPNIPYSNSFHFYL